MTQSIPRVDNYQIPVPPPSQTGPVFINIPTSDAEVVRIAAPLGVPSSITLEAGLVIGQDLAIHVRGEGFSVSPGWVPTPDQPFPPVPEMQNATLTGTGRTYLSINGRAVISIEIDFDRFDFPISPPPGVPTPPVTPQALIFLKWSGVSWVVVGGAGFDTTQPGMVPFDPNQTPPQ